MSTMATTSPTQTTAMDITTSPAVSFLSLPAEIRIAILDYVFSANLFGNGFEHRDQPGGLTLSNDYTAGANLKPLLTCRQFYRDATAVGIARTPFVATNLFFDAPQRLALLHPRQAESVRSIAFVVDSRFFRKMLDWGEYPFGMPALRLDTVTLVLHRSTYWHYLFDFTSDIVKLLRQLHHVKKFVMVRNNALVKGSFKTWCNRLVGLILKTDHVQRYDVKPPRPEKVWWQWRFDDMGQYFELEALPAKPMMEEEEYMQYVKPLLEALTVSMGNEEWNPDPRSRNGF